MSVPLTQILSLTLVPMAATLLGGTVAAYRVPSERARSFVQHFAAGVVFAAVAGELLPEITKGHQPLGVLLGFAVGVAVMLAVKQLATRFGGEESGSTSLLATVGIDVFLDGLLIGVGFAAGARVGVLLTVALTLELLFLGLAVAAQLGQAGLRRPRVIGTVAALTLAVLGGALLGGALLTGLTGFWLEVVLSFGAAALLYLVTEELLTEAHEVKETPLITGAFFAGFVLLYLLELLS